MIAGQNNIPKEIVAQYEISLLNISTIQTDADTFRETISESLPLFAVSSLTFEGSGRV